MVTLGHVLGNDLIYQVSGALKPPDLSAVAHMSLHLKPTMSKSRPTKVADNQCSPISLSRDMLSDYVGDRPFEAVEASSRPVNRPLRVVGDSVNGFLQFCFKKFGSDPVELSNTLKNNDIFPCRKFHFYVAPTLSSRSAIQEWRKTAPNRDSNPIFTFLL